MGRYSSNHGRCRDCQPHLPVNRGPATW